MSFASDVTRFVTQTKALTRGTFVNLATKVHASIVEGSALTGAPGQPVDTGNLKTSWILSIGLDEAEISTNVAYARGIEDGISASGKPISFKSATGGAHSVKLTLAGAGALQAAALAEAGGPL